MIRTALRLAGFAGAVAAALVLVWLAGAALLIWDGLGARRAR